VSARDAALAAYRSLPLPSTADEHWRFTDLAEFDPDAYIGRNGQVPGSDPVEGGRGFCDRPHRGLVYERAFPGYILIVVRTNNLRSA
jgi:hypothetical protein